MLKGLEMNCHGAYYLFLNTSPKQPIKQTLMIKKKKISKLSLKIIQDYDVVNIICCKMRKANIYMYI